ncbi:MAG: ABC transporter permease [Clostridiales bacterium]|nr:ABC transporter permease [Clostridiales bacterium]
MKKISVMFSGFFKYKDLLMELVSRDIKIRYRRSVLGLFWTLLNPILMMTVMTLVFSGLFRFDIENFPIYFFTGHILFTFLTESTTNGMHSIVESSNLINKVYIPKYLFPLSKVLSSGVNLIFSFVAMIFVMIATGVKFYSTMLLTPLIIFYLLLLAAGLSLILASCQVFFRDTAQLYSVFTLLWMYLTPIFYPVSLLGDKLKIALTLNPMVHYITYFRNIVLDNKVPSLQQNITCLVMGLMFFCFGLCVFYRKQDKFILHI